MALRHKWKQRQQEQAAVLQAIADRLAPPKLWAWNSFARYNSTDTGRLIKRLNAQIHELNGLRVSKFTLDELYDPAQQAPTPETPSPTGRSQSPGRDRWKAGAGGPHAPQPRRLP